MSLRQHQSVIIDVLGLIWVEVHSIFMEKQHRHNFSDWRACSRMSKEMIKYFIYVTLFAKTHRLLLVYLAIFTLSSRPQSSQYYECAINSPYRKGHQSSFWKSQPCFSLVNKPCCASLWGGGLFCIRIIPNIFLPILFTWENKIYIASYYVRHNAHEIRD